MVPGILTHDQKQHRLRISSDLLCNAEMSLPVMKRGVFNMTWKQKTEHAVENTEFISAEKSTHVSVAGQDHARVFL